MLKTKSKPSPSLDPKELVPVGAKVPRELRDQLRAIAVSNDRPYQREIRRACVMYVESQKAAK